MTWKIEIVGKPGHPLNGVFGNRQHIEAYAAELRDAGFPAKAKPLR